jgi:methyl-accepting chemotaxis protein/methyl-accepting chemotaxis protein-1 (serine sensor receptor)
MFQMTIGRKIWTVCGFMTALTGVLAATALVSIGRIHAAAKLLADGPLPATYLAGRLNTGAKAILIRMNLHMQSNSVEKQAKYQAYLSDREKAWRQELKSYQALAKRDGERAALASAAQDLDGLLATWQKILPLSAAHQHQEAFAIYEQEAMGTADHLDEAMKSLVSVAKQQSDQAVSEAAATAAAARFWAIAILVAAISAGGVLVLLIVNGVNRTLRRAVKGLAESSGQVASAAAQIAHGSQVLAQGASEQAASLEETSASSEEINAMSRQNADRSRSTVELVAQSQQGFAVANQSLCQMVQAMDQINDSSGKISRIIRVIDEIAFQSNILALNAAVEAARAGEAGMGFAVVADEVRNLAQRSGQAARDITALIEDSIAKSHGGKSTVEHSAESIRKITGAGEHIQKLVDEVAAGTLEQAHGIEQIAQAIAQMSQITQRTAATAEESAAAAQELGAQSAALNRIVTQLGALVDRGQK